MRNLIIITSDEMRGDCAGFAGNLDCKTPHLDALAEKAVVFTRHFAVQGKCVPSRISIMTGRYAHTDGFRTIHQHLPADQPDLLKLLRKSGYETAVFGHNHVWEDFWGDNSKSSGCVDYHSYTKECGFDGLLQKSWPVPPKPENGISPPHELNASHFEYHGRIETPLKGLCDDNRAEQAIHYLRHVREKGRPFFMQLNFSAPHPAYQVEEPYFSMCDRDKIAPWPPDLPENAPLPVRAMRKIRTSSANSSEAFKEVQATYYGMISKMDDLFGRVMEAVKEEALLDNTVILFTSDHGDFAGQYGLIEKWDTAMYDCILRVPMILCAPGLPSGKRVESLTEHVDIAPTLAELLGLKPDWGIHGGSLLPVVQGGAPKAAIFADGGHEEEMWARFPHTGQVSGKQETYRDCPEAMARTKMVRTDTYKLIVRLAGGNELYDLANDPMELRNLWGDPACCEVVMELQGRMIDWCLRTDTDRPHEANVGA